MKKKDQKKIHTQAHNAQRALRKAKASARMLAFRERQKEVAMRKIAAREAKANSYRLSGEEFAAYQGTIGAIEAKMGGLDKVALALRVGLRTLRDRLKKIDLVRKEHILAAMALRTQVKA